MIVHLRFRSWCHFWGFATLKCLLLKDSKTVRVMGYDLLLIVSIESYSWRLPIHVTSRKLYHTKQTMEHQMKGLSAVKSQISASRCFYRLMRLFRLRLLFRAPKVRACQYCRHLPNQNISCRESIITGVTRPELRNHQHRLTSSPQIPFCYPGNMPYVHEIHILVGCSDVTSTKRKKT